MKLETLSYTRSTGWSANFPALDSKNTLVIVYGSPDYISFDNPLQEIAAAYPNSHFIGCSSSGEIMDQSLVDESIVVAIAKFDRTELRTAIAPVDSSKNSFDAGKTIAESLNAEDLRSALTLSDGLNVNGSELVRGINSVLPPTVIVTGGLAGDGDRFEQTWVLKDGIPVSGFVSAVGFYGEHVRIGHGSQGGWDIFGPERTVTKSDGNVLYELDGKPALELYKKYLGERAADLPAAALLFPLALRRDRHDENRVVRSILGVDEEKQSMTFAGNLPEGHLVQLMCANFDRLVHGASQAALMTKGSIRRGEAILSIAISCAGRRVVLGERTEEELEATMEVLPEGTRQVGFYSYGEISPYAEGHCELHNQTMTLTTICED